MEFHPERHRSSEKGLQAYPSQQNPVLVFSIHLTQKRVRPLVWIIFVHHAELASLRALLVKGLDHLRVVAGMSMVRVMDVGYNALK